MDKLFQQIELRDKVLKFFTIPARSSGMSGNPIFDGHTPYEVHQMVHALCCTGFVWRVKGETNNSVYQITDDGLILLEMIEERPIKM